MTLSQTAIFVQRSIIISAVALFLSIASFTGYKIWYAYYLASLPPVEEKPDTKFGQLPQPDFPKSSVSSSNFSYSLDTTTGGLPKAGKDPGFDKILKVYFVPQSFATFLSPERSQKLAEKFKLIFPPDILSETKYSFKDNGKSLLVDLDNGNFSYTNESVSANAALEDETKLVSGFKRTLTDLGILNDDLSNGKAEVNFLKTSGTKFSITKQKSEAQAAQISIWPSAIDKKLIYTAAFTNSLVNAIVFGSADKLENYASLDFIYYPPDTTTYATYPIKTADIAFEDLRSGKGVVIIESDKPQVSITSVSLGYYVPENYSPYLTPIYVFEGPNFVAYVPAISSEFLNN
ncbi:MAG: hypothetical protein ACD_32C00118G0004 [uncultured bacterium]|uniref:Uncharacterized protein n=1 Tax=Candidatus Daviesbacteria bacterium GW2011_GWC2_40_12 TaxID=1618431 RepID=A0A0G0QM11_9BACT|nr:MAG: hypothetical protein ACD_32C00118G0004 [uncultured bacterium]KKR15991.1 MAG: hypothetical protein UT45_C0010G0005 [Candidatus Daviesbacteria bacterium GW2011_GWA2_39_33]KKR24879.1 MAG: hypothetical protein UT54_C0010G0006 [Candidatus Daviesbacteria bacterium GW2011_GWB1_39_5]KKR41479.1 MAG: hypothetical protein UT77_C0010G0005 [Candidatus Daviesbacteria bacterium GW2011_GWC2_40_12]OGE21876.1 MAG: hypothetical protein A2778_03180 [Candidatus Daviesbacteria bacterium RIFCSPHIGHO2_01_FULL_